MVQPADVPRVLLDAARLIRHGELVVFGSAALAFWLAAPPVTRDIDVWCEPREPGEALEALMGELSWYHETHGAYVEVWGPETFAAPTTWRTRARTLSDAQLPDVRLLVPHPHDILFSKLERWESADRGHALQILASFPLTRPQAQQLDAVMPYRTGAIHDPERIQRYDAHYLELLSSLPGIP